MLNDSDVDSYELPDYVSVNQIKNHYKEGRSLVYIHESFKFKIRNDRNISFKNIRSVGVKLLHEKRRNNLFNVFYRPPNGKIEPFENLLKNISN